MIIIDIYVFGSMRNHNKGVNGLRLKAPPSLSPGTSHKTLILNIQSMWRYDRWGGEVSSITCLIQQHIQT